MLTTRTRFEDMDFRPRLPLFRLIITLFAFCFLTFIFINETKNSLEFRSMSEPGFLTETVFVSFLLLSFLTLVLSFLLLQHRLRFTEEGLYRRTLFQPRFIAWKDVKRARMGLATMKNGRLLLLELCVSRWRWVWIPLLEYRKSASLFAEIRNRLPVEVEIRGGADEMLRDE